MGQSRMLCERHRINWRRPVWYRRSGQGESPNPEPLRGVALLAAQLTARSAFSLEQLREAATVSNEAVFIFGMLAVIGSMLAVEVG